jgi:hypothetical protein
MKLYLGAATVKITQTYNGYKDPEVFGVCVCFEYEGKEYTSYVDFHRRAPLGEILSITYQENEAAELQEIPEEEGNPLWSIGVTKVILEAAKDYIRDYYGEDTSKPPTPEEPPAPKKPYQSTRITGGETELRSRLKSV